MIPRSVIDEVVRRTDIQQLIGTYVPLRRSGSNYTGLCPFHSEKTPSFTVFTGNHEGFYCFGCGVGGDCITFIKKIENLDYTDAIRFLASRVGVTVEETQDERKGPTRERIRELNIAAARLFHAYLLDEKTGKKGMEYLTSRQISPATIKHFYLGYAPEDTGAVGAKLLKQGFTEEELLAAFICGKNSRGLYDYFRGRVIYPIVDTTKNIVGFGGRVLGDALPKYLNTSDTPAFRKRSTLFAMNYAKENCSKGLILCEGYMDVITLHQAGFTNSVATLGTSITDDHARMLSKYTKTVYLSYDSDEPGQKATLKATGALEKVGIDVKIIRMSGAKDPDEFIKKFGADAFGSLLTGSVGEFDFKLDRILAAHPGEIPEELIKASDELSSLIAEYSSSVERDLYITRVCQRTGLKEASLSEDVRRKIKKNSNIRARRDMSDAVSVANFLGDKIKPEAASNVKAAAAEDTLLALLMMYDEYRAAAARGEIQLCADDFPTAFGRKVFEAVMRLESSGGFEFSLLGGEFSDEEMSRLEALRVKREGIMNGRKVLEDAASVMKEETRKIRSGKDASTGSGDALADLLEKKRRALADAKTKKS
ncbi:MAG: DNA primase [Clostridiales bacterium]|nr:DNA primase [Clostridiales bacterium]